MIKNRRKQRYALKNKEKAQVINRILSTDPEYIINNDKRETDRELKRKQQNKQNDILILSKRQQTDDIISSSNSNSKFSRLRFCIDKTGNVPNKMVHDSQDLDLIGFVE